ncbi:MAG: hypothetical protein JWL72_2489 [Ilumatobacteraceae bacterium]|nr:hypothetical protein [Ilumatobacteraceae bacterium]MCU1389151.1 hypothetical protein [Ilumatobacteraceae bacterium]
MQRRGFPDSPHPRPRYRQLIDDPDTLPDLPLAAPAGDVRVGSGAPPIWVDPLPDPDSDGDLDG